MKFTFFSGVIPLEKVKIMKSCEILILEKTENCLESVIIVSHETFKNKFIYLVTLKVTLQLLKSPKDMHEKLFFSKLQLNFQNK